MHDRLDCYDDKALPLCFTLSEREVRMERWRAAAAAFEPFDVICIDDKYTNAVRYGVRYQVIGEEGECWTLAETNDIPLLPLAKKRFIRPEQLRQWLSDTAGELDAMVTCLKRQAAALEGDA